MSEEYPRLFRFVEVMPTKNIIAMLIPKHNLLLIHKEHWEHISDYERERVMRTQYKCLEITYPGNHPPVIKPSKESENAANK